MTERTRVAVLLMCIVAHGPVSALSADSSGTKERVRSLEAALAERGRELDRVRAANRKIGVVLERERRRQQRLEKELAAARADEKARRLQLERLQKELAAGQATATREIQRLEKALRAASDGRAVDRRRVTELERKMAAIDAEAKARRDEVEAMGRAVSEQHRTAATRIESLEADLTEARTAEAEAAERLAKLRNDNEAIGAQMKNLREEAERAQQLESRLHQQEFRIQELEHSREAGREEVRDLNVEKKKLETLLGEVQRRREESAEVLRTLVASRAASAAADEEGTAAGLSEGDASELQRSLDTERERRRTLEQEVERLSAAVQTTEEYRRAWEELQGARAEILVLGNQLAAEREERQELERVIEQAQRESGGKPLPGSMTKLTDLFQQRKDEAERLATALHDANETIVRLKGQLEATGSPEDNTRVLSDLEEQNKKLRDDLSVARAAVTRLNEQAKMAERLADLVYSGRD